MKKYFALLILALMAATGYAQDDDVYFVPSKANRAAEVQQQNRLRSHYERIGGTDDSDDNWAVGRGNNGWDVDAYNRRGRATNDSTSRRYNQDTAADDTGDGNYTTRLVRFHSPRVGVIVSSPYYDVLTDYYWDDPWFSPWYASWYSPWYSPWYSGFYYSPWYGWGWRSPYYAYWDPWWGYGYGYGWGWGWHPHYGWGSSWASHAGIPNRGYTTTRPSRDYLAGNRYLGGSYAGSSRPSRSYYRPSNSASNRTFNIGRTDNGYRDVRPSRSYGNSNDYQAPSRSQQMPSRSWNTGGGFTPSRSFGQPSGGGRSFGGGGGGGRSFGGRR